MCRNVFLPALHCMAVFDGGKDGVGMKADLDVYKMSVLRFEFLVWLSGYGACRSLPLSRRCRCSKSKFIIALASRKRAGWTSSNALLNGDRQFGNDRL